jgi:hypothetical protein
MMSIVYNDLLNAMIESASVFKWGKEGREQSKGKKCQRGTLG